MIEAVSIPEQQAKTSRIVKGHRSLAGTWDTRTRVACWVSLTSLLLGEGVSREALAQQLESVPPGQPDPPATLPTKPPTGAGRPPEIEDDFVQTPTLQHRDPGLVRGARLVPVSEGVEGATVEGRLIQGMHPAWPSGLGGKA